MKNINTRKVYTRRAVSGALYDFIAYLTSLKEPILLGASEDPLEVLDHLVKWSQHRGLNVDDRPDVNGWDKKV